MHWVLPRVCFDDSGWPVHQQPAATSNDRPTRKPTRRWCDSARAQRHSALPAGHSFARALGRGAPFRVFALESASLCSSSRVLRDRLPSPPSLPPLQGLRHLSFDPLRDGSSISARQRRHLPLLRTLAPLRSHPGASLAACALASIIASFSCHPPLQPLVVLSDSLSRPTQPFHALLAVLVGSLLPCHAQDYFVTDDHVRYRIDDEYASQGQDIANGKTWGVNMSVVVLCHARLCQARCAKRACPSCAFSAAPPAQCVRWLSSAPTELALRACGRVLK